MSSSRYNKVIEFATTGTKNKKEKTSTKNSSLKTSKIMVKTRHPNILDIHNNRFFLTCPSKRLKEMLSSVHFRAKPIFVNMPSVSKDAIPITKLKQTILLKPKFSKKIGIITNNPNSEADQTNLY